MESMKTDLKVSEAQFNALLRKLINTPPIPLAKLKGRRKRKANPTRTPAHQS
jgi:hypothetical protein